MRHVSKFQIVLITAVLPLWAGAGDPPAQPRMWREAEKPAKLTRAALVKQPVMQPEETLSREQGARFETKKVSSTSVEIRRTSRPLSGLRRLFGKKSSEATDPAVVVPQTSETLQRKGRLP